MKTPMDPRSAFNAIFVVTFSRPPEDADLKDGLETFTKEFRDRLYDAVLDHIQEEIVNAVIGTLSAADCNSANLVADGTWGLNAQKALEELIRKLELAEEEKQVLGAHC